MVARFHLWLRNILVVNNRWRQYSIKIVLWLYSIASTSISLCKLGKYTIVYLMMLYSLAVVHGTPCIPSLTKFTDHQSHARALLILTHAAIQVVYINTFRGMFVVC